MKTHWSIEFKSASAVGILLLALSGVVIRARATASSGLTNVQLARGNDTSDGTIPLQVGTDIVMIRVLLRRLTSPPLMNGFPVSTGRLK